MPFIVAISYGSGAVISLLLEFLPNLSTWFHALTSNGRRGIVLGVSFVLAAGLSWLTCHSGYSLPIEGVACGTVGQTVINGVMAFVLSLIGSQNAHQIKRAGG